MTGSVVYLNATLETFKSLTQKTMSLATTKAELNAAVMDLKDALLMKNIPKSLELKVKLSILTSIDNSRAVDIGINWRVGGRTHHVKVKQNCLWKLKEAGIIELQVVSTVSNDADMFMKIHVGPEHNKHVARLCGCSEYYGTAQDKESHRLPVRSHGVLMSGKEQKQQE